MPSDAAQPLPFRENAVVTDRQLGYLLDDRWRRSASNKVGLMRDELGFTHATALRAALVWHARRYDSAYGGDNGYGDRYMVTEELTGPSGRSFRTFTTVWFIERGGMVPRLSTVTLGKRRKGDQ